MMFTNLNHSMNMKTLSACLFAAVLAASPATAQLVLPYSHDFSGPSENFASTTAGLTLGGGTLNQTSVAPLSSALYVGLDQVSNLRSVPDFAMSYQFSFSSIGDPRAGIRSYIGFSFLGTSSTATSNPSAYFYFATNETTPGPYRRGKLTFGNAATQSDTGTAGQYSGAISGNNAVAIDTTYTLKLSGLFTGTSGGGNNIYDFSFGLYDAAGTTQLGTSATLSNFELTAVEPVGGYYGGLFYRLGQSTGTYAVDMDNFAAVPEPSTWALLAVSLTAMVILRRRRIGQVKQAEWSA